MVSCTRVHPIVSKDSRFKPLTPTTPCRTRPCTSRPRNPMKAWRESSIFGNKNQRPKWPNDPPSRPYPSPPSPIHLPFNEPKERIDIALQDFSGFVGCSTRQILKAVSFKMRGKRCLEILKKWKLPIDIWKNLSLYIHVNVCWNVVYYIS